MRRFRFLVDFGLSGRNVKEAVGSKREPAEYGWHFVGSKREPAEYGWHFKLTDELFVERIPRAFPIHVAHMGGVKRG